MKITICGAPYTDWSLEQYNVGAARLITLPSPADDSAIATLLTAALQPNSHVYLLDYRRNANAASMVQGRLDKPLQALVEVRP